MAPEFLSSDTIPFICAATFMRQRWLGLAANCIIQVAEGLLEDDHSSYLELISFGQTTRLQLINAFLNQFEIQEAVLRHSDMLRTKHQTYGCRATVR